MRRALLLLLALVTLAACTEEVDPTGGADRPFTLYGYLDPTSDRQALRVVPIDPLLVPDTSAAALPVTVTSLERETGRTATWRDSVVTYWDGSVGHVFVADYRPTPGATVDVRVVELGEPPREVAVAVEVPLVRPSRVSRSPLDVLGTYRVQVDGVPNLQGGVLRVFVSDPTGAEPSEWIEVPIEGLAPAETAPGSWLVAVPFSAAVRAELVRRDLVGRLRLSEVEFVAFVTNEAWAGPRSRLPDAALVEPGTFSNVEGGFGFVGAGYGAPVRWTPSPAAQEAAGFQVEAASASALAINEVSLDEGWVELFNPTADPIQLTQYALRHRERLYPLPVSITVPAQGFVVLASGLELEVGDAVELVDQVGQPVLALTISPGEVGTARPAAYGSYPDGQSRLVRAGEATVDVFRGPLLPTRGGPNAPADRPLVINEVLVEAGAGWVEVVSALDQPVAYRLATSAADVLSGAEQSVAAGARFGVAPESATLPLSPAGGELLLVARYTDRERKLAVHRVVDVRRYEAPVPGRSAGLLPDADYRTWTDGLRPTRGAPNAAARFGP